jgi:hypothetical protein
MARVQVDRVWRNHFGRGLVPTADNFGKSGTPPTHPELLEFLAGSFVDSGWRIKDLHRLILHSGVYRQTSTARASSPPTRTTRCTGASRSAGSTPRRSATRCSPSAARSTWPAAGRQCGSTATAPSMKRRVGR